MSKKLQELSNEELLNEAKKMKLLLGVYGGLILVMLVVSVITTYKKGFNTFTCLPLAFLGILVIFFGNYSKANKEIKARNLG